MVRAEVERTPVARFDPHGNGPLSGPTAGDEWGHSQVGQHYLSGYSTNDYQGPATLGDAGLFGGSSAQPASDEGSHSCRRAAGLPLETRQ